MNINTSTQQSRFRRASRSPAATSSQPRRPDLAGTARHLILSDSESGLTGTRAIAFENLSQFGMLAQQYAQQSSSRQGGDQTSSTMINGHGSMQMNRKVSATHRNTRNFAQASGGAGSQRSISQEYLMRTGKKSPAQRTSASVLALMA